MNADDELLKLPEALVKEMNESDSECLFSVSYPNRHIYLVLMVERILLGSQEDALRPYLKKLSSSEQKKIETNYKRARDFACYRQLLMWGYVPLFLETNESGECKLIEGVIDMSPLYQFKGDMDKPFDVISTIESKKENIKQRFKVIPATLEIEISMKTVGEPPEHSTKQSEKQKYLPTLVPTQPGSAPAAQSKLGTSPLQSSLSDSEMANSPERKWSLSERVSDADRKWSITESTGSWSEGVRRFSTVEKLYRSFNAVEEFPVKIPRTPYVTFMNTLYVYPKFVNMEKVSKVRNVCIEVLFRSNDENVKEIVGEPRIISRYSENLKQTFSLTSVTFHDKHPQFFDEIKIDIPIPFKEKDHLLFKFYTIYVDEKVPEEGIDKPREELGNAKRRIIGYSFLKISEDGYIIQDKVHQLVVYKQLDEYYLSTNTQKGMEPISKRPFDFTVETHLKSSLYPKDTNVKTFFTTTSDIAKAEKNTLGLEQSLKGLSEAIEQVRKSNFERLLPHFPVIINMLFNSITSISAQTHDVILAKVKFI